MLAFIKEKISLWEYLKTVQKPIVLYGTGDGADKILARLQKESIQVRDIYVSDTFARGQIFRGYAVKKISDLQTTMEQLIVLIAFASERPEVLEKFHELADVQEVYAPHVPLFQNEKVVSAAWLREYEYQLQQVYERLADEFSRRVFASILNYKLSGKLNYLQECTSLRRNDIDSLFHFDGSATYVDLGAYDGDTVEEFLNLTRGCFHRIYAVEPDSKNFVKLQKRIIALLQQYPNVSQSEEGSLVYSWKGMEVICICAGVWSQTGQKILFGNGGRQSTLVSDCMQEKNGKMAYRTGQKEKRGQVVALESVDHLLRNDPADYIKYDVEGVEAEALQGTVKHLVKSSRGRLPQLLIAAYHHDEDIFKLPLLLWQLQPEYEIYLRKHPYIPAWELNIFAR